MSSNLSDRIFRAHRVCAPFRSEGRGRYAESTRVEPRARQRHDRVAQDHAIATYRAAYSTIHACLDRGHRTGLLLAGERRAASRVDREDREARADGGDESNARALEA